MNTKSKTPVYFLIMVMMTLQVVPVSAQGGAPNKLTPVQMKNAVVVEGGSVISRAEVKGDVYRFADCDGSNPDVPCYFVVTGSGTFAEGSSKSPITPLASSATITCGVNVYNYLGNNVARLQQNVNVTFWGTYGQTPVTLNWGDLRGTATYGSYYSWSSLTGPNPNPGWGVYVSRTGTAYSNAGGLLVYAPPPVPGTQVYVSSRITIRSSGWSCS
jgi:hypothetical protein